jgi:hypothetical protein
MEWLAMRRLYAQALRGMPRLRRKARFARQAAKKWQQCQRLAGAHKSGIDVALRGQLFFSAWH